MLSHAVTHLFPRLRSPSKRRGILSDLVSLDRHYRSRRHFERLDSHLRRDVGIGETPSDQGHEQRIWDRPLWWR